MEQNLVANFIYKPLTEEQSELINQMRLISTPRQLRYFLIEHPQLQDINTQALNAAINLKGYKISRRRDKIIVYSQGRKQRKESQEQSSEQLALESSELQMQHMIEQIFAHGNQCYKDQNLTQPVTPVTAVTVCNTDNSFHSSISFTPTNQCHRVACD
ncbi:MAG: hypothetical protein EZS28_044934, partial [Streblomastix strix]